MISTNTAVVYTPRVDRWGIERRHEESGRPSEMKTELARWLKANKQPRKDFADALNISMSYVNQICSGAKVPSRDLINAIARHTKEQVNWTHWPSVAE